MQFFFKYCIPLLYLPKRLNEEFQRTIVTENLSYLISLGNVQWNNLSKLPSTQTQIEEMSSLFLKG